MVRDFPPEETEIAGADSGGLMDVGRYLAFGKFWTGRADALCLSDPRKRRSGLSSGFLCRMQKVEEIRGTGSNFIQNFFSSCIRHLDTGGG